MPDRLVAWRSCEELNERRQPPDDSQPEVGQVVGCLGRQQQPRASARRSSARCPCNETSSWIANRSAVESDIEAPQCRSPTSSDRPWLGDAINTRLSLV